MICLSLHCNESDRFLYANGVNTYQFKSKHSEIKKYPLCLGKVWKKYFAVDNIKITRLNRYKFDFSV